MTTQPLISIIIPFYNAKKDVIFRCIDSIYSQGLEENIFEVIVVDDCSSNHESKEYLNQYIININTPPHLCNALIISHPENKRQGGARNTAIREAKGEWAVYIDQDDYFKDGSLSKIIEAIKENLDCDLLMCDCELIEEGTRKCIESGHYSKRNDQRIMLGAEYIRTQEVPWVPWCTVYNISYLKKKNIWFEENVKFEDKDYVLKSLVLAEKVRFIPIELVCHTVSNSQQSAVGNNFYAIEDLFKISDRVRKLGESVMKYDEQTAKAILGHHWHGHKYDIIRYLWRLSPKQIRHILTSYPVSTPSPHRWLDFTAKNPNTTAAIIILIKPILPIVRKLFLFIKKRKNKI